MKRVREKLGKGYAEYSVEGGKVEMVGYESDAKPHKAETPAEHIVRVNAKASRRLAHLSRWERALEHLSAQCSVCKEYNGCHIAHESVIRGDDYFNICVVCLAETLTKDGSAIPAWVWERHPKYGYGIGGVLCRFVRERELTNDFMRCFAGKLPAAIMQATFASDFGHASEVLVEQELKKMGGKS